MNVKNSFIVQDSSIKYPFFLCIFFIITQLILLAVFYNNLPPLIPLFNSLPWGESRLAFSQFIFLVPAVSIIVILLNLYIAKLIYTKHTLVARILTVNGFLISLLGFLALAQILLLVF